MAATIDREAAAQSGSCPKLVMRTSSWLPLHSREAKREQSAIYSLPRPSDLIEPLSERELEVLKLLRTELNGPEIARELHGVSEHRAYPHQKHLRQAGGEQPPGGRPPRRRTRFVVTMYSIINPRSWQGF